MCEFVIFNTQKGYEKQKNFGNFSATLEIQQLFGNFLKKIAAFWQLLDTFMDNFFGIHRQLVAKPNFGIRCIRLAHTQDLETGNKISFFL